MHVSSRTAPLICCRSTSWRCPGRCALAKRCPDGRCVHTAAPRPHPLQVDELSGSGPSSVAVEPSTRTLARACLSVMCVVLGTTGCPDSLRTTLQNMEAVRSHPGHAVVKQALFQRAEQHTAALNPPVTAADLQQLDGLLELQAAHRLIQMGGERQQLNKLKDTALRAIQRLRALGAGSNAAFLHRRASDVLAGAGKLREALPESRAALRLATAEKGEGAACSARRVLAVRAAPGSQTAL